MSFKKIHTLVAVVAIVAISGVAYWWQHRPGTLPAAGAAGPASGSSQGQPGRSGPGGPSGPVSVEVGRVAVMSLRDEAQAVGSLRSRQAVVLRPEVSGRISALGFTDGQRVRKGQLMVQLDDALQVAQLQQAEAQAGIARTSLQRNRELLAQNFVSASVVDQAQANLQVAEAQVALAKAQLSRLKIVAPFDALVGIRAVNLGDYVKDGADLVSLEDSSSMWVEFRLPERFVPRLKGGQAVDMTLDALPKQVFQAKVDVVDVQFDANGRSMLVRAKLMGPTADLRSGLFARVNVVLGERPNALVVPEEALVPQGGKQYIIKVVDGPKGKQSQRVEARLGMRVPGKVELLGGVQDGDVVVTAGQARLMRGDGLPVKIVDVDKQGGAPRSIGNGVAASGPASAASR
ncbi:MAG: efflux RND transporter periplasmic adaptor subunit [Burkholderiaceae bacterium]|nr:efflux RND transporter periplasmic adaptor subunit [Burkholderiaceae bacterium]